MSNPHCDRYRLMLVEPSTRSVFVEQSQCGVRLPRISIPRWTRAAAQIQAAIEQKWGFNVAIVDLLDYKSRVEGIVIAELRCVDQRHWVSYPYSWGGLNDISDLELSGFERSTLGRLLNNGATGRGFFSRFGWIEEALDWVSIEAGIKRTDFTQHIRQFNASATCALVRFGRNAAPPVWFKAVQDPTSPEYKITTGLTKLFPSYVPKLLASREDWHAWFMEDSGLSLEIAPSPDFFAQTVSRLAELQKASISNLPSLLDCGCVDQRTSTLRSHIPQIMEKVNEAMAQSSASQAPRLEANRIREIGSIIEDLCLALESLGIPDTLLHGELSFANILVGTRGCVFTDWAQPAVGNPFVNFEQLRAQIEQERDTASWLAQLTEVYRRSWLEFLTEAQIKCALALMPPIALAMYLFSRWRWLGPDLRREPEFQSYLRGLARQMDRATKGVVLETVRCT